MLRNASEVIRLAIDQCDFDAYRPNHDSHRQVSVRIGVRQRAMLKRFARAKRSSVGELLRIALEELLSKTAPKKARR
jgi:Arc/MetJ-type ribon-helix-helix transcriptional regulator